MGRYEDKETKFWKNIITSVFMGCFTLVLLFFGIKIGIMQGTYDMEVEAFSRGYMVECVGVEGYYWECEEE